MWTWIFDDRARLGDTVAHYIVVVGALDALDEFLSFPEARVTSAWRWGALACRSPRRHPVENPYGVSRGVALAEFDGLAPEALPLAIMLTDNDTTHRIRILPGWSASIVLRIPD